MNPSQRDIHERNVARFSQTEAGDAFSSHTSKQGRLFQVFAQNRELRGAHSVLTVIERCTGSVNGYTRKEITRYHGVSPISLLKDLSDEDLLRDVMTEIRNQEQHEEEDLLREVAQAMIDAFNVVVLAGR